MTAPALLKWGHHINFRINPAHKIGKFVLCPQIWLIAGWGTFASNSGEQNGPGAADTGPDRDRSKSAVLGAGAALHADIEVSHASFSIF